MHTIQERSCNSAFVLPRNCTFSETDWKALAPFWYPIAFSHEVTDRLFAAKVLDERLVLFRLSDSSIVAARDLCLHRGVPLSSGWVENDDSHANITAWATPEAVNARVFPLNRMPQFPLG
jgi:hypothetical protein